MSQQDLQIDRAESFLNRERMAQRLGVIALCAFVVAGALGAFGNGPLGRAHTSHDRTELTYERFGRTTAPTSIAISIRTTAADGEPVRFRVERAFLGDLDFLELRPPDALKGFDDGSALFEVAAAGGRAHVELHYKPSRPGIFKTDIVPEGGAPAPLWQLIYF